MLAFLLWLVLAWRTVMFQLSGFYCIPGRDPMFEDTDP